MVIGVTGKYCSGKNFITHLIETDGFFPVDVDTVGHEVLKEKKSAVVGEFGPDILYPDGSINRRALGTKVFGNTKKRRVLEKILHPEMKRRITKLLSAHDNTIINAALLFPMGLAELCDAVIIVHAPFIKRFQRARKRDSLGVFAVLQRMFSQMKILSNKKEKEVDIYRVDNRFDEIVVAADIERIMQKLISDN